VPSAAPVIASATAKKSAAALAKSRETTAASDAIVPFVRSVMIVMVVPTEPMMDIHDIASVSYVKCYLRYILQNISSSFFVAIMAV